MRLRKAPLWSFWAIPFVIQIFGAVGLVAYLSFRNGQQAVSTLAHKLIDKASQQVSDHLDSYLALPIQLVEMNVQAIAQGDFSLQDRRASERYFWRQSKVFPGIGYVGYALPNGSEVGAGRWISGLDVLLYENLPGKENSSDYLADAEGNRAQRLQTYDYEPTTDSWYQAAATARKSIWARTYAVENLNPGLSETGKAIQSDKKLDLARPVEYYMAVTAAAPFYSAQGRLLGVMNADVMLSQLSEFLVAIKQNLAGEVFLVDSDGLLIGSSTPYPILQKKNDKVEQYAALDSPDPLLRAIAPHLFHRHFPSSPNEQDHFVLDFEGKRYFVQITNWRGETDGLNWKVIVTVPESSFMGQIDANTRQTLLLCVFTLLGSTLVGLLTCRWVTQPIWALNQASHSLATAAQQGKATEDLRQQLPPSRIYELDAVGQSFNRMANQLHQSFAQLEYTATRDSLTGLLNRAAFHSKLVETIAQNTRFSPTADGLAEVQSPLEDVPGRLFAVLFLDLDLFKLVNDSLGHLAGDQLLIEVAHRLRSCVRATDVLARFGGDEFVILLEPIATPQHATRIAERIILELKKPFVLNGKPTFISTSIGIVFGSAQTSDAASILRNADIALYRAKAKGKANYEVFDDEMHTEVVERLQLETDLRQAIYQLKDAAEPQFQVYYQPIVETRTLRLIGVEALIRWHHPSLGTVSPGQFIPIAEETGLIVLLGDWVLWQSCQQMRDWQNQFPSQDSLRISVNLSTRQFLQPDLSDRIADILQETGLDPRCLDLEITEGLLVSDRTSMQRRLDQLKKLGIQLSLDDFGTGYSSLSYLHSFRVNTVKIDRSFIQNIPTDNQSLAVVEAILLLCHRLGLTVVAEGVETQEQLDFLRQIGCDAIQGFLTSPAVPAKAIATWLT